MHHPLEVLDEQQGLCEFANQQRLQQKSTETGTEIRVYFFIGHHNSQKQNKTETENICCYTVLWDNSFSRVIFGYLVSTLLLRPALFSPPTEPTPTALTAPHPHPSPPHPMSWEVELNTLDLGRSAGATQRGPGTSILGPWLGASADGAGRVWQGLWSLGEEHCGMFK